MALIILFFTATVAIAEEQKTREIFVPFSDLHVLLQNQPKRVLIGRKEYEELLKKAERAPDVAAPLSAVFTAADYAITADRRRAEIVGNLTIDVLRDGLHALPLDLAGVGLRAARLDGRAASIALGRDGRPVLFVEGVGQHRLELEMTAPLESTAARQVLSYRLPRPPAASLRLEVPGDVEIKGGTDVISRKVDAAAKVTRFELLPKSGDISILMTLNSHLLRTERAVIARSAVIDTVSEAYEQMRAAVTMSILHKAVDRFRFVVPEGFEITDVTSPLLSRWDVVSEDGRRVLEARLNEPTTEKVTLDITAIRAPAKLDDWAAPRLVPLDVIGSICVFGLKVDDRLTAESLVPEGLIPLDTSVLGGDQNIVAAYYAPSGDYSLKARFVRPPAEMAATTSLLLVVSDKGLELQGGVSLSPKMEKRFSFDLSVPAGWQVTSVTTARGRPLPFEFYPAANSPHPNPLPKGEGTKRAGRVRVSVLQGMKVGAVSSARFVAVSTPKGWLDDWRKTTVVFPNFDVLDASESEGAIAVESRDDIAVQPDKIERLTSLGADDRKRFGLAEPSISLAYRRPAREFTATLTTERTEPRLTARSISFFRVDRDTLYCHSEVNFTIEQSRVRQFVISLPADTPETLNIVGLDGVKLKEYTRKVVDGRRRWTVLLAEPRRGRVRLAVDFQQRLPAAEAKDYALPIVEADGVSYQSGLVAVEGCAELEVDVKASLRRVDVGELAEADYQPGRRLLGAYEFVGNPPSVKIDVVRRKGYEIPSAIVEKCELDTVLSPEGWSRHQAVFQLRSKALFVRVELPRGAKLWAAELDGVPMKPQRDADGILIDLSAGKDGATKRLKITYADDRAKPIALRGTLRVPAPKLFLHNTAGSSRVGQAQHIPTDELDKHGGAALRSSHPTSSDKLSVEIPLADMVWRLHLPSGYEVVSTDGTLSTTEVSRPQPAAFQLAGMLFKLSGGGEYFRSSPFPSTKCSRSPQRDEPATLRDSSALLPAEKTPETPKTFGKMDIVAGGKGREKHEPFRIPEPIAAVKKIEAALDTRTQLEFIEAPLTDVIDYLKDLHHIEIQIDKRALDSVEESAIPFDNDKPIAYPDAEVWGQLSARRKGGSLPADISSLASTLSGVRSLKIDLLQPSGESGRTVTFRGLGVKPRLVVTLADDSRFHKLRLGLALAVVLFGVAITRRKFRVKMEYILAVMLATTLGAMIGGLEIAQASNWMFFAAAMLVPYFLLAGCCRWAWRMWCRMCAGGGNSIVGKNAATIMLLIGIATSALVSFAGEDAKSQAVKKRVIHLPKDAIILPYDPEWKNGIKDADKLLVPYDKYVELWNRAYPDKKIETKAPPADFALADAAYKTTLEGNDSLTFAGRMQIDVFAEGYVQVPLGLAGGVLTRAELDGKPARLSVLVTPRPKPQSKGKGSIKSSQDSTDRSVVILHVTGKGRHTLELDARMKLERQGGWRVVQGVLPSAPVAALDIVVPQTKTELRLDAVADCRRYETEKPDQTIRTALGKNGAVSLRWRPEVASGQIDRSLTAASNAVFDVREDGLGLDWRLTLEFRNAERDRFDINLPEGYMLEKVEGANVRGWRLRTLDGRPSVEIELLQTAKGREEFTLRLWRGGRIGRGDKPSRFDVPVVTVADAALQSGRVIVRRSPLLELQTLDAKGVTRIDLPPGKKSSGVASGPLGIRPFESYSFATVPFAVRLSAEEVETRASAVVESVLKLGEYEQILESRVTFDVRRRPVHLLRVLLPEGYTLNTINMPCRFHHTVTKQGSRPLLTVYLASGKVGETPLLISGTLKHPLAEQPREMPFPRVEVLEVDRQSGDVAVQTDPSFDVELLDPSGCESVLQGRLHAWLNPNQRDITRLALHTTSGDYSGKLRLTPRTPDVTCDTITNVRVTARAMEETILLDYHVARAGVRRLEFLLPESMADSRVSAPMMQRKTTPPAGKKYPGMVRVVIELQEEAMGDIRVVVENDRLLTPGSHEAPIPVILGNIQINRRYVVLENAGRGEVVVDRDKLSGMNALGSHGKDWAVLKAFLGDKITMAYMASSDAERPRLSFHVATHAAVDTVKASIGLAETTLVMDAAGAYRAEVILKVNNETEQYLDVQLPPGASLWTAQVAGEPVKPTQVSDEAKRTSDSSLVRIPLLKTAPGDLDYEVVLRYGGHMPAPSRLGVADFPMVRCVNITPALCNAKLYLPEQYRWFDFGGTMRRVAEETELDVGRVKYQNKQLKQIGLALEKGDKWAKSRATFNIEQQTANNRKQIGLAVHNYQQSMKMMGALEVPELQAAMSANKSLMQQTQKKLQEQQESVVLEPNFDNRQKMNDAFASQIFNPSSNVAIESGSNWGQQSQTLGRSYNRSSQSVQMTVTPRGNLCEGGRLIVQPPTYNDPFGPDAPQPQGGQTLGRNYNRHRFGYDGPEAQRPGNVPGLPCPESTLSSIDGLSGSINGDSLGGRGRQSQQAQEAKSLNRYQERLAKQGQTDGPSSLLRHMESLDGLGYAPPPTQKPSSGAHGSTFSRTAGPETAQPAQTVATSQPTGLASLDFTLPTRGRVYRFITPRGEQQITARYVSDDVYRLSKESAVVGFAIIVILLIVGMVRRGRLDWLVRPLGTWLMLVVGFVSLFSGFLPIAAIVLIVVACVLKIRWLTMDDSLKRKHAM